MKKIIGLVVITFLLSPAFAQALDLSKLKALGDQVKQQVGDNNKTQIESTKTEKKLDSVENKDVSSNSQNIKTTVTKQCAKEKITSVNGISKFDISGIRLDSCVQDIPVTACADWKVKGINNFIGMYSEDKKWRKGCIGRDCPENTIRGDLGLISREITNNYPKYHFGPSLIGLSYEQYKNLIDESNKSWSDGIYPLKINSGNFEDQDPPSVMCGYGFKVITSPSGQILSLVSVQNFDKNSSNGDILLGVLKDFGIAEKSLKVEGSCAKGDFGKPCSVYGKFDKKVGFSFSIENNINFGWFATLKLYDLAVDLSKEFKEIGDFERTQSSAQKLKY
jgi:hypothetical protein